MTSPVTIVGVDPLLSNLLSGFVGAVVGAVVAAYLADRTARGLQRNDREHEQNSAARVIVIELIHNQNILETFRQTRRWQSDLVTRGFWESEGAQAAQGLTPEELVAVGQPYLYMQALESIAQAYRADKNEDGMLESEHDHTVLNAAIEMCGEAITVLQRHTGFTDAEIARLREFASK